MFDCKVWDYLGQVEDTVGAMQEEEEGQEEEEEEEGGWFEGESLKRSVATRRVWVFAVEVDEVSS